MVITVWLHMYRVFLTGSYKPPREFNWVVGVILLVLTLLLSFTGYLLPWDQLAIWAITVGLEHGPGHARRGGRRPWRVAAGAQRSEADHVRIGREVCPAGRPGRRRDDAEPILRAALRGDPAGGRRS